MLSIVRSSLARLSLYSFSSFTRPRFSLLAIIARRYYWILAVLIAHLSFAFLYLYSPYRSSLISFALLLSFAPRSLYLIIARSSLFSMLPSPYRSSLISFALLFVYRYLLSLLFPYYSLVAHNISLVARYYLSIIARHYVPRFYLFIFIFTFTVRRSFIAPLFSRFPYRSSLISFALLLFSTLQCNYFL